MGGLGGGRVGGRERGGGRGAGLGKPVRDDGLLGLPGVEALLEPAALPHNQERGGGLVGVAKPSW